MLCHARLRDYKFWDTSQILNAASVDENYKCILQKNKDIESPFDYLIMK